MSDDKPGDPLEGAGQGGGTGGTIGNEAATAPPPDPVEDRDPGDDAWEPRPADEEHHPPADLTGERAATGPDEGRTEDGTGAPGPETAGPPAEGTVPGGTV